jgi:hypothetical protein
MKLLSGVIAAFISSTSMAADNVHIAVCSIDVVLSQHSLMPSDFFSKHGFSITNSSSIPMNYKIVYQHEVMNMFSEKKTVNIVVNPGQTVQEIKVFSNKKVWEHNGQFQTRAMTVIFLEGKRVDSCANNNYAYIT